MTLSDSIVSSRDSAAISGTSTLVAPHVRPTSSQPIPPMWNSGIATRLMELSSTDQYSGSPAVRLERLRLVVCTPLGRPVVPEVYSCRTTAP